MDLVNLGVEEVSLLLNVHMIASYVLEGHKAKDQKPTAAPHLTALWNLASWQLFRLQKRRLYSCVRPDQDFPHMLSFLKADAGI